MSKLLILDNSPEIVEMMKFILERHDYRIKTLMKSENLDKEISEFQPDLLIIDIFLADEDGREICKKLKNNTETAHLGILVISSSHKILKEYKSFYADEFLEKPFDLKTLLEKITSVLFMTKKFNTTHSI